MSRPTKRYVYISMGRVFIPNPPIHITDWLSGPHADEHLSQVALGQWHETVNGTIYGSLSPEWEKNVTDACPGSIDDLEREWIHFCTVHYMRLRAGFVFGIPWTGTTEYGPGIIDRIKKIHDSAATLLSEMNSGTAADNEIWRKIGGISGENIDRDLLYKSVADLVRRSHIVETDLLSEKDAGSSLDSRMAWHYLIQQIASMFEDKGWKVSSPKIEHSSTADSLSPFARVLHELCLCVPAKIREYGSSPAATADAASAALTALRNAGWKPNSGAFGGFKKSKTP